MTRCWPGRTSSPTRERRRRYKSARGKGGLVRASWDEATEMIAAAHVHTIKKYGPDRVAGFSPDPGDVDGVARRPAPGSSRCSAASMLSFYDWYADLPVASPQVFGDQTDVPESGDWWDAGYLIMWGSNLPVTRTPDAHWMAEARYRGQKVVAVSPGLRRQRQVRRRVAARRARHRRGAGDGDGTRDPQGVLRRPAGAVLHRLRQAVHRPAVPGHPRRGTADALPRRASSSPPPTSTPPATRRTRRSRPSSSTPRPASRSSRTARSATASASREPGTGTSTSATSTRCCRCIDTARESVPVELPRFDTPDGAAGCCAAASRYAGSAGSW